MNGLTINVYRSSGMDCTGGGASSRVDRFVVVGAVRDPQWRELRAKGRNVIEPLDPYSQVFEPSEARPAAVLVRGNLPGSPPNLVPLDVFESGAWSMYGGNIASSSDSRMADLVSSFVDDKVRLNIVQIHDRVER